MPDDERNRRRLGDETKGRIADLASGWSVDSEPAKDSARATPDPSGAEPARKKPKTFPPPPPGSAARKNLENQIVESATSVALTPAVSGTLRTTAPASSPGGRAAPPPSPPPVVPARAAKPTSPPPIPPARLKPPTAQVPVVKPGTGSGSVPAIPPVAAPSEPGERAVTRLPRAQVVVDDDSRPGGAQDKLPVPVGEFDGGGGTLLDKDKLRIAHQQSTIKRDTASVLLGITEAPLTRVTETPVELLLTESAEHGRGDPTSIDPSTSPFERGDPTQLGRSDGGDSSTSAAAMHGATGRLRTVSALRRQRGILGDVRYVSTALFGVRRSRRELVELDTKQSQRQLSRRRHLITLGRTAVSSEGFDHPAVGRAREQLGTVEDERARHTGQVAAADQELARVHRDREANAKQYAIDIASIDAEIAELAKRYEPLIKEQATVTKRGAELRDSLRRLDAQIAETTASLVSVKGPRQDPAAIQAELATVKADRVAVQRDEPKIAGELDALNPRIAAIEAKRGDSQTRRAELVEKEQNDQRRTAELLEAIGAKRKVMDRAANDAETLRDKILFELGERLYVDRPDNLTAQLAPIESIDVELGTHDRRGMELKEILSSIDRAKFARGVAVIVLSFLVVGALTAWLLYIFL